MITRTWKEGKMSVHRLVANLASPPHFLLFLSVYYWMCNVDPALGHTSDPYGRPVLSRVQLYFPSRTAHRPSGASQICRDFQAYLNVVIFKERLYEDSAFLNSPCSPASVQWVPAISSNMEGVYGRAQGRLCDQRGRGERGVSILINIYGHTGN